MNRSLFKAHAATLAVPRMYSQSTSDLRVSARTAPFDSRSMATANFSEQVLSPYAILVMCGREVSQRKAKSSRSATVRPMKNVLSGSMPVMLTDRLIDCNNCPGNSQPVKKKFQYRMDTKEMRLMRLRQLIADKYDGVAGQFADAHGMKRPQVSRWITKNEDARQGIDEASARRIEQKENLPSGWLDRISDDQPGVTTAPLVAKIFALPCSSCGHVSHQSFIDLEMNNEIPCPSCGVKISVAYYYGQTELAEFLKSLGAGGFVARKR